MGSPQESFGETVNDVATLPAETNVRPMLGINIEQGQRPPSELLTVKNLDPAWPAGAVRLPLSQIGVEEMESNAGRKVVLYPAIEAV